MKTKYIITTTSPDNIDAEGFDDSLENCQGFTSRTAATKAFNSFVRSTNMVVHLLKVELVDQAEGSLFDDDDAVEGDA